MSCPTTVKLGLEFQLRNTNSRMNVAYVRVDYLWNFTPTAFSSTVAREDQLEKQKERMRQVDYNLGRALRRKKRNRRRLVFVVAGMANDTFIQRLVSHLWKVAKEMRLIRLRTRHISNAIFNVSVLIEEESVCYFRSTKKKIQTVFMLIRWSCGEKTRKQN